jgi:hypothetical protein
MGGERGGTGTALACAIGLMGLLTLAACQRPATPTVQHAEAIVSKLFVKQNDVDFSDVYQCGDADAVMGDATGPNEAGIFTKTPFVYANGEAALQTDADAFIRLTDVCTAGLQAQTNQLNTNRAAINAVLVKRGIDPDGPPP